jgi:hypothetical protein
MYTVAEMARSRLDLTRSEILAFRRHVGALDERLPPGARSLRRAAWAGLQDSMPRAALLQIHARVEDTGPASWEHPALVQVWGPRYSTYVVPARDFPLFTRARLPDEGKTRANAEDYATRLHTFLAGRKMTDREVARGLGIGNRMRYATLTGRILIRWEGARAPLVWTVPQPDVEPRAARLELARRYLHVFGPTTPPSFARWAGIGQEDGVAAFDALRRTLTPVRTPVGDAWMLTRDEPALRSPRPPAPARLLPSGDAFFLLHGVDRELVVPQPKRRAQLWTSRVWPGAVLVEGEIVGTWRRAGPTLTVQPWQRLTQTARAAVEAEAATLPLPGMAGPIGVRWDD